MDEFSKIEIKILKLLLKGEPKSKADMVKIADKETIDSAISHLFREKIIENEYLPFPKFVTGSITEKITGKYLIQDKNRCLHILKTHRKATIMMIVGLATLVVAILTLLSNRTGLFNAFISIAPK